MHISSSYYYFSKITSKSITPENLKTFYHKDYNSCRLLFKTFKALMAQTPTKFKNFSDKILGPSKICTLKYYQHSSLIFSTHTTEKPDPLAREYVPNISKNLGRARNDIKILQTEKFVV